MEFDQDRDIDPTEFPGSVLQFAACPGPDEIDNVVWEGGHGTRGGARADSTPTNDGEPVSDFIDGQLAGIVMVTRRAVCSGEQLLVAYEADEQKMARWFRQAGCEWRNVGCDKFPARRHRLVATVTDELFEERRWADYSAGRWGHLPSPTGACAASASD